VVFGPKKGMAAAFQSGRHGSGNRNRTEETEFLSSEKDGCGRRGWNPERKLRRRARTGAWKGEI